MSLQTTNYSQLSKAKAAALLELRRRNSEAGTAPKDRTAWLNTIFPRTFTKTFADRQLALWDWVDSFEPEQRPPTAAYVNIEPRGGGKTTTAETAVIRAGALESRKFVLYVRGTQDKANESVKNIASKLESRQVETYYPDLASRSLGKYGHSKGWTVSTLRCKNGFNVVALGLDAAVRGVKLEDYRPDWIIFDDIDDAQDTPKTISKKVNIITTSILPAGADHCAYLVTQNLIHASGIVSQLVDGTADFLNDRILSGPHPAIIDLAYEYIDDEETGKRVYFITSGTPTWEGQGIEKCEQQINDWGISAFLREAQHEVDESGGLWDHIEFLHIDYDNLPAFERSEVWCDPAVTSTDESDCMAIAAGGMWNNKLYVVHGWEKITSPEDAIKRAVLLAIRYGSEALGVETDQGGDTWASVYRQVCQNLLNDDAYPEIANTIIKDDNGNVIEIIPYKFPVFRQAKAGAGHGSKVHRNGQMMVDYEHGKVYHVRGAHTMIEKSLKRFPKRPLDLADALYWLWYHLMKAQPEPMPKEQPKQESKWQGDKLKSDGNRSRWKR